MLQNSDARFVAACHLVLITVLLNHRDTGRQENNVSETLYGRRNVFREIGFRNLKGLMQGAKEKGRRIIGNRWSDCSCESCVSWMKNGDDLRLHVVVQEPHTDTPSASINDHEGQMIENVVFLHGFISSSSFWTQTVFRYLTEDTKKKYRLFAVDLLGFGTSPKPKDCLYTLDDHVEMIEKSVILPLGLKSFHLVAHSMGSIIALALAAKHQLSVRTVTLIAPPYFPSPKDEASFLALGKLAEKRLWPPLLFGTSFMSWYEHLGRTVCFFICKYHRAWEFFLRQLTRQRELHFLITDTIKHTHHSAWHTMHNVVCGGAKYLDECFDILSQKGVKMTVIQGDEDQVVPLECSFNIKMKIRDTNVIVLSKRDHITVVLHQTKEFTQILESIWRS
ncbi:putative lysophospholipase BODYGUARD 4 isoform X1 [Silene latifolia]|uniref:putative lysophospholipase BODYGUARD 4 isoform X1 n=1 Tax=Silene latifolia TaxID=37657 RepID=UPI003D777BBC